ncbi:MAG: MOSC domain-containing protein [Minisyncoccia bacterium]
MELKVKTIWIFPVKSCGGIEMDSAKVCPYGFEHDHEFMVVDENGRMVSQREYPKLCLVRTALTDNMLHICLPSGESETINLLHEVEQKRTVQIHRDSAIGFVVHGPAAELFCDYLGARVGLVRHVPRECPRTHYCREREMALPASFADGYAVLVTTRRSLKRFEELCDVTDAERRLRPQLILDSEDAYKPGIENRMFSIVTRNASGNYAALVLAKRSERCVIPSIDPQTGVSDPRVIVAMKHHYSIPGVAAPCFASNFFVAAQGTIKRGGRVLALVQ